MDAYVERKLTEWNLMALKDNFIENCIDEEAFSILTLESLKELIPTIGLRLKFWKFYEQYKQQEYDTKKSVVALVKDQQRTEHPGVSGVHPHQDSGDERRGTKRKIDSLVPNYVEREWNEIKSGDGGSTSVQNAIIGGRENKLEITNNVYGDPKNFKSKFQWRNLHIEYRNELISKPLIILQGQSENKISLATLLGNANATDVEELIDDYTLYKLNEDIDIDLGIELPVLGETEPYFIPRTFLSRENTRKSLHDLISEMTPGQTTIISDNAGTGKSVILKVMTREMKKLFPNRWVIFVNLRSYASIFEEQLNSQGDYYGDVHFFVSKIYNSKCNENDFEINLLKWCLEKSGGVVLLFDGYDEISPKYAEVVKGLLLGLRNSRVDQLIVTTRTHSAADLEEDFQACSYRLQPFNEEDKLSFIVNYWLQNSDCDKLMIEDKANHLIEILSSSIEDNKSQFMGIPLQCRLLAETYKNKLNSSVEWETMSLYELYRQFTSMKFEEEENKYQSTTSTFGAENNELAKLRVHEYHWESGFRLFFEKYDVKQLKFQRHGKKAEEYLLKKVERVGIMTRTGEDPVFIHRTFAEFFVAEFFIESLERLEGNDFFHVLKFMLQYLLDEGDWGRRVRITHVVRKFFKSGLKTRFIEEDKFRLVQSSIMKVWRLDLQNTFLEFRDIFSYLTRFLSEILKLSNVTYEFLLRCIIVDGNMPIDLLSLVAIAAPVSIEYPTAREIYLKFISSCPKNVQEIIMVHILCRADETLRQRLWDSFIPDVMTFTGIKLTSVSLREKMTMFEEFLQASSAGDVDRLRQFLRDAGNDETKFWLLNGGICTDRGDNSDNRLYYYNQIRYSYISSLINVIINNEVTALEFLLDKGAARNPIINPDLIPPLFTAIEVGNLKCLEILLKRGADKNSKYCGKVPMEFACHCGTTELVTCLLDFGCEISDINDVLRYGTTDALRILINRGFDCNQRGDDELTVLHYAVSNLRRNDTLADVIDFIKLLFTNGIDIEDSDSYGRTALHMATEFGRIEGYRDRVLSNETKIAYRDLIKFLLQSGANIQAEDKKGQTPLHLARDAESVSLLLDHGAQTDAKDFEGKTPLHTASWIGRTEVIRALIDRGAKVNATNNEGQMPLHLAAGWNAIEPVSILLEKRSNIDAVDEKGKMPLNLDPGCNKTESVSILLENGANIDAKDNRNQTVLHYAATGYNTNNNMIIILLEHGAKTDALNNDGDTPLQHAICKWDCFMEPLSFLAKEAGSAAERPTTYSLKEAFQIYTRSDISAAISEYLDRHKGEWLYDEMHNLAETIMFLSEHEQQFGKK